MIVQRKIKDFDSGDFQKTEKDKILVEWYETNKRLLHKKSELGKKVVLKFLNASPDLKNNDLLVLEENYSLSVEIIPYKSLVISANNSWEIVTFAYEIGNRHLPLFYEQDRLLVPFDKSLHAHLLKIEKAEFLIEDKILDKPVRTTVAPHGKEGIFTKIMQLTGA